MPMCPSRGLVLLCCLLASLVTARTSTVDSEVISLNETNFDARTKHGAWLITVSVARCKYCQVLDPIWVRVADQLLGRVNVAKIDGDESPRLAQRFGVRGFPSIYYLQDEETWEFTGQREEAELLHFALEGWHSHEPLPFYQAPNSLVGRLLIGPMIMLPKHVQVYHTWLHKDLRLPHLVILLGALSVPVIMGLVLICMLDSISMRASRSGRHRPASQPQPQPQHQHQQ